MSKILAYLFLFVLIVGVIGFGFFTMTMPNIPQQLVTRTLDPKDAFAATPGAASMTAPVTAAPAAAPIQAPAAPAAAPVSIPVPASAAAPE